jgi:dolichol-phosphate mannosyltransferase
VVVVDDGSSDTTASVVRGFPSVELVQHSRNRGLGVATRTLLRYALAHAEPDDLIVTMDADNTMDPELIPELVAAAQRGADLVIASRFAGGEEVGVPWHRRLLTRGARALIRSLFPVQGVHDYTCGYRLYRLSLLARMARLKPELVSSEGFTVTTELLLTAAACRAQIAEVPFHLRYDLKRGRSKMPVLRTSLAYLGMLTEARFRTARRARRLAAVHPDGQRS